MAFSETLRLSIRKRAHFRCCICRAVGVEIHHIIPQEERGHDTESNAAPLCPSCHELYGANPTKRKFIREARDFWYELCKSQVSQGGLTLSNLSEFMAPLATKGDLAELKDQLASLLNQGNKSEAVARKKDNFVPVPIDRFIRSLYDEELERQWPLFELLFDSRAWYELGEDSYDLLDRRALFLKLFGEETAHRVCLIEAKQAEFDINGFTEEDLAKVLHSIHVIVILITQHKQITQDREAFECAVRPDGEFIWRAVLAKSKRRRTSAEAKRKLNAEG
jgi:hypothetical protein